MLPSLPCLCSPLSSLDLSVPIPTYLILGQESTGLGLVRDLPNGGPLCPNLEYLGRAGVQTLGSGGKIRVAYLSGVFDPSTYDRTEEKIAVGYESVYTSNDVNTVVESAGREGNFKRNLLPPCVMFYSFFAHSMVGFLVSQHIAVDILLTAEWGRGYHHYLG